jgi:hypothetical protein
LARPKRQPSKKKTPGARAAGHTPTPAKLLGQRRKSAQHWLPYVKARYEETKNPVFVWEAYLTARAARLPSPTFVLEYFDRVGLRFASMSRHATPQAYRGPERRSEPTRVRRAALVPNVEGRLSGTFSAKTILRLSRVLPKSTLPRLCTARSSSNPPASGVGPKILFERQLKPATRWRSGSPCSSNGDRATRSMPRSTPSYGSIHGTASSTRRAHV